MPGRLALLSCATGGLLFGAPLHAASPDPDPDRPSCSPSDSAPPCSEDGFIEIPLLPPENSAGWRDIVHPVNLQNTLLYAAGATLDVYGLDPRDNYGFIRGLEVPIYQDGMRRPFGLRSGSRPEYFTLSRLELLRGPAALLNLPGAPGALVNLVTKAPEFVPESQAFVASGSFQRREAGIDLTGPVADDILAGRVIALWRDTDQARDYAGDSRQLLHGALKWMAGPDTSILLSAQFQRDKGGWAGLFLSNIVRPGALQGIDAPNLRLEQKSSMVTAQAAHQISHSIAFQHNMRIEWLTTRPPRRQWRDDAPDAPIAPRLTSRARIFSSDTRIEGHFGSGGLGQRITVGVDHDSLSDDMSADGGTPDDSSGTSITRRQQRFGWYVEGETRLRERAALILGVRHDHARQYGLDGRLQRRGGTSARIGLMADVGSGLVPYFSYSKTYLPIAGVSLTGMPLAPQRSRQAEAGLRWQATPAAMVSAAVYDMTDRNRLIGDSVDPFMIYQADRIDSRGIEIEASYTLPGLFDLAAAYGHISAKDHDMGDQPYAIPRHTASIWANRQIDFARDTVLQFGFGLRYVVEGFGRDAGFGSPDYLLADALLVLQHGDWSFNINAANLFDRRSYATCLGRGECFAPLPRTISAALGIRF